MGKNLFSIGGLYFGPGAGKGVGATWGVSSDAPGRLRGMILRPGVVLATVIAGDIDIHLKDIEKIDTCDRKGKGKQTCVRLSLQNGAAHVMDLKKGKKAQEAAFRLSELWRAALSADSL